MVSMGYPLLCAVSRKRFVGAVSGVADANARDAATQGVCIAAIENGARILRVHDVAGCAQAINSYWAVAQKDVRQASWGLAPTWVTAWTTLPVPFASSMTSLSPAWCR